MNVEPPPDPHDDDLGRPIAELAELAEDVPDSLIARIRASIGRRWLVSDALDFSIPAFLATVWEYVAMLFAWTGGETRTRRPGPADDRDA